MKSNFNKVMQKINMKKRACEKQMRLKENRVSPERQPPTSLPGPGQYDPQTFSSQGKLPLKSSFVSKTVRMEKIKVKDSLIINPKILPEKLSFNCLSKDIWNP